MEDSLTKELRDGKEVVVIPADEFEQQFKKKRVSQKQKILQDNDIDLKYLKFIQYKKREGTYSFKITGIPSIEELKRLISVQESY